MILQYQAIGYISSPYKQKFAIPRQSNLVPEVEGHITLTQDFADPNSLRCIDQFSHLWLLFHFHATADQEWSPTVQPPRLGGKERVGVFASRSPFRPNPIGMSVVTNLGHQMCDGVPVLKVGGIDLLEGTPILDIKPYIPYADSLPEASGGYAIDTPGSDLQVVFSSNANLQLKNLTAKHPKLESIIKAVLSQDPRPAWRVKDHDNKHYGMSIYDFNVKWQVQASDIVVLSILNREP